MLLLGLDLESTDKDPHTCRITEVGAILFETQPHNQFIKVMSELVFGEDYAPSEPGAVESSGITDEMIQAWGSPPDLVLNQLAHLMRKAGCIVAHNGYAFDRPLLQAEFARAGIAFPDTPWLDTMVDIPYSPKMTSRKLDHLISDHNIPWDRRLSHRAVFDVAKMLLMLSHYDFADLIAYKNIPTVVLRAMTTVPWSDKGESNAKAKRLGFRYRETDRAWVKAVKETEIVAEIDKARAQENLTVIVIPDTAT